MFSKKTAKIISVIVLIGICVTGLSITEKRGYSSYGSGIAIFFVAPFQKMANQSIRFVTDIWNHYFFIVSVAKKNDRLQKKLGQSIERNNHCKEIERSNSRLRSLLRFRRTRNERIIAAEVISKDPSLWFKSITIDKGKSDGIEKGLPVVNPEGIIGLITDASHHYSRVLLIIDQNSAVDALVQRTRARGIVKGESDKCLFKYVLRKHEIQEGDTVVSSGLDGIFPKGLLVGRVLGVTRRNSGIFQEITVLPYVDFEKLEEVLVILDPPRYIRQDNILMDKP